MILRRLHKSGPLSKVSMVGLSILGASEKSSMAHDLCSAPPRNAIPAALAATTADRYPATLLNSMR